MAESSVTPDKVLKDLKDGKYAPVYFLQGEEPYYIDLISGYIENNCLPESERGFNQTILYGKDTNVSTILQNARKYPMFSDRQVVMIKEAQDISDLTKDTTEKFLIAYLENPLPTTILVFCHKYKKLDARKKITKHFTKHAVFVESSKIYDNKLPDWINNYVRDKGYKIEPKAVVLLAESIGVDLSRMANEIDKLLINVKDASTVITEDLIEKFVGVSKEYNVFELQKAIGIRDIIKANKIVNHFEANTKANPIVMILTSLFSYYLKILAIHAATDKSEASLAKVVGVHPFFVKEYINSSKINDINKCIACVRAIRDADKMVKGYTVVNVSDGFILKELIFKLLH
ncbi:DNA polymerase III subunit delta [uncultured Cytophaga sp.]|uniref:DNA polymerase III subunit delta n=1 Tax=uncultured Cytophaga sp. TaxID=160238 RepID=UPI002634D0A4|nr:DNA polymerase III subunit delta [uncultured Cytophaga sp.]